MGDIGVPLAYVVSLTYKRFTWEIQSILHWLISFIVIKVIGLMFSTSKHDWIRKLGPLFHGFHAVCTDRTML